MIEEGFEADSKESTQEKSIEQYSISWSEVEKDGKKIQLRRPVPSDGPRVNQLVASCPPLDTNSVYCNVLQCDLFADTCVVAEHQNEIVAFVSAFLVPQEPSHLFVWQIVVHPDYRGLGLALKLLDELMLRSPCRLVTAVRATINPDNAASWALFEKFAQRLHTSLERQEGYPGEYLGENHEDEVEVLIGPIATPDHAEYNQEENV